MNPKIIFAKLEDIPEHLRAQATKLEDGTFALDAKGVLDKNSELLTDNKKFKTVYDKFKELGDNADPKVIKKALEEMQSADDRERQVQVRIQAAVQGAAAEWQKKLDGTISERDRFKGQFEERVIDGDLTSAITEAKGDPFLVLPRIRDRVKTFEDKGRFVAKVVDENGQPRINAKGEPMKLSELVEEAKQDKRFARGFEAPAASGSGAGGNGGGGNQGAGQVITLTREQAKDTAVYRQAMADVKGDMSRIAISD